MHIPKCMLTHGALSDSLAWEETLPELLINKVVLTGGDATSMLTSPHSDF